MRHDIFWPAGEGPRLGEYTAEHMYEEEVAALSSRLGGTPILSQYGAGEVPGVASQCWAGNAHISMDGVVVEFLRPDGTAAESGELAEIVLTPLYERGVQLFR